MPQRNAAVPSTWLTVTTPVPPMPVRHTENRSSGTTIFGAGSTMSDGNGACFGARFFCTPSAGSTVTNDGQSPFRHDMSWLHDDWWISVLRPNSVSTGCTLRQFDFLPQSPQPSQTRSLMKAERGL